MPRTYTRKTGRVNIDEESMKSAIKECIAKRLKVKEAARQYGIKRTTLQSRIKTLLKKKSIEDILRDDSGNESEEPAPKYNSKYTAKQVFTRDQEDELSDYIKKSSNLHYGLSYRQIRTVAYEFAKSIPNCNMPENWERNKAAGLDWLFSFMKRHQDLSLRKPESTSLSRSMAFNKPVVDDFFGKYASVLEKYKFRADQVWNLDETGITTVARPVKVVSTKGKKQVGQIASAERGSLVTFVGIINGVGATVPPIFVFPRIRNPSEYLSEGSPLGSVALGNKSGWMTVELFPEVLKQIVNHTHCSQDSKILLLIDNHESHISVEAIRYCKSNGIVLLSFPPHTTHRLQPLDVGVYAPFKAYLATAFNDWMLAHPGQAITIRNIGYLANKAYENAFSIKNITHAFEKTGLWPINRLVFSEEDFVASSVTDRPLIPDEPPREPSRNEDDPDNRSVSPEQNGSHENDLSTDAANDENPNSREGTPQDLVFSAQPSTSRLSLEELVPYPKATIKPRSGKRNRSKSTIYTDTPELNIRENMELTKKRKMEVKKNAKVKRGVFKFVKKVEKQKMKKHDEEDSSDSEISMSDVNSNSSDDLEELESASEGEIELGDYVLVKFQTKTKLIHYAGRIEQINDLTYTINFMRRRGFSQKFFFPSVEDITDCNISDIVAKLQPPPQTGTARTSSMYTFSYNFSSLNVK